MWYDWQSAVHQSERKNEKIFHQNASPEQNLVRNSTLGGWITFIFLFIEVWMWAKENPFIERFS